MENGSEPATKADITALHEKIEMLRTEVNHGYGGPEETSRDNEPQLLAAFHAFAQSNPERLTQAERDASAWKDRSGAIRAAPIRPGAQSEFPGIHPSSAPVIPSPR
jgi:hypothetical protein